MSDLPLWIRLVVILLLVAGNAFFVGSEIAISSARRSRIRQLAEDGNGRAKTVRLLHEEPERFYSVTQIGITLVSLGLGAVGMETLHILFDPYVVRVFTALGDHDTLHHTAHLVSYVIGFIVVSFVHIVGGELAPKVLAFHRAEPLSLSVGKFINVLYLTFRPLIAVMKWASDLLLRLSGQGNVAGHGESHFTMSVEEIRMILEASEKDGLLDPGETEMIRGVFELDEQSVRDAMVPRTQIRALAEDTTLGDALRYFRDIPHARFPVYVDSLDKITGVVAIKELLTYVAEHSGSDDFKHASKKRVKDFAKPPFFVPDSKTLDTLLADFKRTRQQLAVVIDEYGGTEGIITLEDILEEIVGDYEDEFTRQSRQIRKLEGSSYEIEASMRIADLEDRIKFPFPEDDDYVTLGGLFYKLYAGVPDPGDTVALDGGRLTVLEMDNHRITLLRFDDTAVSPDGSVGLVESTSPADPG
ncbi:MAG: HlyC/CorC family transporter [Tetrasphaera sp.]|nr:HlyC/CorC family transporter [Tetrasphaera sp.]